VFAELIKKLLFPETRGKVRMRTSSSFVREKWAEIEILQQAKNPSSSKQAIIVADKVLEQVIKQATNTNTLGEGLKLSKDLFSSYAIYDMAWKAHKVRNSMVHDANYDPPHYVVNEAISQFKSVFRDLGLLK